jgi:predicted secreted protein
MKSLIPMVVMFLLFVGFPGGDGWAGAPAGNETQNPSRQQESTSGRFELEVGQEFTVTLASNASTGYHWELTEPLDESMVNLVTSEYQTPETRMLGATGKEIWTFRAVGQGETVVNLKYVRPWEKDIAPVKTASYLVIIR